MRVPAALRTIAVLGFILGIVPVPAQAYFDDFESGSTAGWPFATSGGISGFGVETHNSSKMAFVYNIGSGSPYESNSNSSSLSQSFSYSPNELLSFVMQASASPGRACCGPIPAGSGVSISFLNFANVPLASEGFVYYTDTSYLGTNYFQVSPTQQTYSAKMSEYAALAGLDSSASISKISLTFYAWARYSGGGNIYPNGSGTSQVWFDNVQVGAVPEPGTYLLMICGLVTGIAFRRSRSST